jgi:hypothetical protein
LTFGPNVWLAFGAFVALMFHGRFKPGHALLLPPNAVEEEDGHYWVSQTGADRGMSTAGDCLLTRAESSEGFPLVPFVRHFPEVKAPMRSPWDGFLTKPICARMHRIVMGEHRTQP